MIERQAIRAAIALAAASSHGRSPEVIADLRDESSQLMGLCVRGAIALRELQSWCDDATALVQRLAAAEALPDEQALHASAAVLRLRLATTRAIVSEAERLTKVTVSAAPGKRTVAEQVKREPVKLTGNLQVLAKYLKENPDARTKDIIAALSGVFSPRSIKRYLSELVALHAVSRRESGDGGVLYALQD